VSADEARLESAPHALDVERLRRDFPILARRVHGKPLVYLDSAASTQKPRQVIQAVDHFYRSNYANVHRGIYRLSSISTAAFEGTRDKLRRLVGARDRREIVFTSGTTGAINLVAHSWGDSNVGPGDEIVVTQMEHHSNIVPWQLLCERAGARLRVAPIDDDGRLMLDEFERLLGDRTKLVAVAHTSNALGTRNPVRRIVESAHAVGAVVVVDGAQAAAHDRLDAQADGYDFLAMSGHKMLGPTGVGALYGRAELLERMPPFMGGGEMIHTVSFEGTTYKDPPYRFEAGTPDIAGVIGLGSAIDYLNSVGLEPIERHEHELLEYATARLTEIPGVRLIGTAADKGAILSFIIDGIHPHDAATALDLDGVAVRAGHHCAQPVMERFGVPATLRASLACYSNRQDIDALVSGLRRAIEVLG
jgi:cysteine desulfurase/selenocysteine lyase